MACQATRIVTKNDIKCQTDETVYWKVPIKFAFEIRWRCDLCELPQPTYFDGNHYDIYRCLSVPTFFFVPFSDENIKLFFSPNFGYLRQSDTVDHRDNFVEIKISWATAIHIQAICHSQTTWCEVSITNFCPYFPLIFFLVGVENSVRTKSRSCRCRHRRRRMITIMNDV